MLENRSEREDQLVRRLDEVTAALDALSDVLTQEEDVAVVLQRVCGQVVKAIPGADMASVTMLRGDRQQTAAKTDDLAKDVDEAQYRTNDGPCLEAAETGRTIRAHLTEVQRRWPSFAEAVAGNGVDSYLSAPLFIDTEYHGALNLYGLRSDGYRELDAALLELYTTAAEAALRGAQRYQEARRTADQLRTALTSRAVIDQAKGIVMGARRIPADEAFDLLIRQSQRENIKLRDVAERLVTRIIQPDS